MHVQNRWQIWNNGYPFDARCIGFHISLLVQTHHFSVWTVASFRFAIAFLLFLYYFSLCRCCLNFCLDGHAYTISAAFFPVQKSGFEVVNLRRRYKSQRIQCSTTVWCCVWWWFCRKYHKYMCLLLVYQTNHQLSWYIQHTPPKWILFVGKGKH